MHSRQQAPRPAASGTAPDLTRGGFRIADFIELIRELNELMAAETKLLRAMNLKDFAALQKGKLLLVDRYQRGALCLRESLGVEILEQRLREELLDVVERMNAMMKDNEAALKAAQEANRRIVENIVESLASRQGAASVYSRQGAVAPPRAAVALRLDERF